MPEQVVTTDERLKPREFQPTEPAQQIWLAAPKTTDAIYLLPASAAPGLALHRLPARSDAPSESEMRWLGVRAAALSATYLIVNRASLFLDIDPEEFDVLEPRLYGRDTRLPLLEFTDHLVNGAGFCRALASAEQGIPALAGLIDSILRDQGEYPRSVFEAPSHQGCHTACYRCLLRYGNQSFHGLLDWQLGMTYLRAMVDPNFRCGLDGHFDAPGLAGWQTLAMRVAREMAERFGGRSTEFGDVPAFSISVGRSVQSPWVLVAHPLWNWNETEPLAGILENAFAQALNDGPGAPYAWDTFNLDRRQVMVREKIKQAVQVNA